MRVLGAIDGTVVVGWVVTAGWTAAAGCAVVAGCVVVTGWVVFPASAGVFPCVFDIGMVSVAEELSATVI